MSGSTVTAKSFTPLLAFPYLNLLPLRRSKLDIHAEVSIPYWPFVNATCECANGYNELFLFQSLIGLSLLQGVVPNDPDYAAE
jgi:hypothetical protein